MRKLTWAVAPAPRELMATELEPDSVVNTGLSETFSDSMVSRISEADTLLDAFFTVRSRLKLSPAMIVSGSVV